MILPDFDARTVQPQQPGGGGHPPGIYEFQCTSTYLKPSENGNHLMLFLELTSPVGKMTENFIVAGTSAKAIEIAQKQLSAFCHAVSIFHVAYPKNPDGSPIMEQGGHSLRGGRGRMEIVPQLDKDKKETGYMEIKKFFDVHGNEPGKSGAAPQPQQMQQMQQAQPQQQAPQGQPQPAWGAPQQQQAPQQQAAPAPAWGNAGPGQAPQQQAQPNPAPAPSWGQPQQQQPNAAPAWAQPK